MTLDLDTLVALPNIVSFLRVIRAGETNQTDAAYTEIFGGSHFQAPPWEHPRKAVQVGNRISTAAGAYQFLARTWDMLVGSYRFADFSPENQDKAAVALIAGRGALQDVIDGRFQEAVHKCAKEWASLPGSPYGQPTRTLAQALETYSGYGGQIAEDVA